MDLIRLAEKLLLIVTILTVLLAFFLMVPFNKILLSMGVMHFYDKSEKEGSLIDTENIDIDIPGGRETDEKDWYPLVLTYRDRGSFSRYSGEKCELTILYNFPEFVFSKGCSALYDPESDYYSSFYGAYLVKCESRPYGFIANENEPGSVTAINEEEVAGIARYDYQQLVLRDFGLSYKDAVFDFTVTSTKTNVNYVGSDGWYYADAELYANGCGHVKNGFVASYVQYGIPNFDIEEPLAPVHLYGRIYGKYYEDRDLSVFFYIIAADRAVLESCDKNILSKSTFEI